MAHDFCTNVARMPPKLNKSASLITSNSVVILAWMLKLRKVQVKGNETFFDRVLEYWARNYKAEKIKTKTGNEIKKFVPVISISILSFTLFDDIEFAHTSHMIHCVQNKKLTNNKLEIHFLELPKMHTLVKEDELKTWLTYFGSKDFEKDKGKIAMQGEVFKKAVGDYEYFRADNDLVSEYVKREVYLNGQSAMLEREFEKGEEKAKLEIAKSLLNSGLSVHDVIKHTGLTEEQIKEL